DAHRNDKLVGQLFTGRLMFNYGLLGKAVIGVQLPFTLLRGPATTGLFNDGSPFFSPSPDGPAPGFAHQGLGDIVIHGKVEFLDADAYPVGLAGVLRFGIPTGDETRFAGEPGVWLWPSIVAEYRPHERVRM